MAWALLVKAATSHPAGMESPATKPGKVENKMPAGLKVNHQVLVGNHGYHILKVHYVLWQNNNLFILQ